MAPSARAPESPPCRCGSHPRFSCLERLRSPRGGEADPKHHGTARGWPSGRAQNARIGEPCALPATARASVA
eukprot:7431652-Pyramimonas_sp.AAC.1